MNKTIAVTYLLLFAPLTVAHSQKRPPFRALRDLRAYVGTFPCLNGVQGSPVLLSPVRRTLGNDSTAFIAQIPPSTCTRIEEHGDYVLLNVSQMHTDGMSAFIVVRPADAVVYVFWLPGRIGDLHTHIYGPRPIPDSVMVLLQHAMNAQWGHVACFWPRGDSLAVDKDHGADAELGRCLTNEPPN